VRRLAAEHLSPDDAFGVLDWYSSLPAFEEDDGRDDEHDDHADDRQSNAVMSPVLALENMRTAASGMS